jgi:PadR family transcriptional regulator, regulatory protein PadR
VADTTDVIQGTLDLLILKSLLVALQRLERGGYIDAAWRVSENSRRAKFYALTRAGKKQLEAETADWTRRAGAVARLLKAEA